MESTGSSHLVLAKTATVLAKTTTVTLAICRRNGQDGGLTLRCPRAGDQAWRLWGPRKWKSRSFSEEEPTVQRQALTSRGGRRDYCLLAGWRQSEARKAKLWQSSGPASATGASVCLSTGDTGCCPGADLWLSFMGSSRTVHSLTCFKADCEDYQLTF